MALKNILLSIFFSTLVFSIPEISSQENAEWALFNNTNVNKCFGEPDTSNNSTIMSNIENVSKILIDGSSHFALNLFRALNQFESQSNGIIFSPHSLWSTLMVAYLGSKGATENEIKNKLKLKDLSKSSVALAFQGIRMWSKLKNQANNDSVSTNSYFSDANKLFVANTLPLNKCFADIFSNEIEAKNFAKQPTEALEEINQWISNQTNGNYY